MLLVLMEILSNVISHFSTGKMTTSFCLEFKSYSHSKTKWIWNKLITATEQLQLRIIYFHCSLKVETGMNNLFICVSRVWESNSISLSCRESIVKSDVLYFAVCGRVPSSRIFCVDKVWGAAVTRQGGNFLCASCQGN